MSSFRAVFSFLSHCRAISKLDKNTFFPVVGDISFFYFLFFTNLISLLLTNVDSVLLLGMIISLYSPDLCSKNRGELSTP